MQITQLPPEKQRFISNLVARLQIIPGMEAVVLGGSHARGSARPDSDIDIGLYYRQNSPFPMDRIRLAADEISRPDSPPTVAGLYEWGPWVNGGAWVQSHIGKVDLLYRNLDQVWEVLREGKNGICQHDYDQQPPYGFRSIIYFAETHACVPLYDPGHEIERLKCEVAEYPAPLREQIIQSTLWGAEFSLRFGSSFAAAGDVYNAVGCMTRVAQYITQALFALNREYFMTDKGALSTIESFRIHPQNYASRLSEMLANTGRYPAQLQASIESLTEIWREVVVATEGLYKSRY